MPFELEACGFSILGNMKVMNLWIQESILGLFEICNASHAAAKRKRMNMVCLYIYDCPL
jgi:hypothetical protein